MLNSNKLVMVSMPNYIFNISAYYDNFDGQIDVNFKYQNNTQIIKGLLIRKTSDYGNIYYGGVNSKYTNYINFEFQARYNRNSSILTPSDINKSTIHIYDSHEDIRPLSIFSGGGVSVDVNVTKTKIQIEFNPYITTNDSISNVYIDLVIIPEGLDFPIEPVISDLVRTPNLTSDVITNDLLTYYMFINNRIKPIE